MPERNTIIVSGIPQYGISPQDAGSKIADKIKRELERLFKGNVVKAARVKGGMFAAGAAIYSPTSPFADNVVTNVCEASEDIILKGNIKSLLRGITETKAIENPPVMGTVSEEGPTFIKISFVGTNALPWEEYAARIRYYFLEQYNSPTRGLVTDATYEISGNIITDPKILEEMHRLGAIEDPGGEIEHAYFIIGTITEYAIFPVEPYAWINELKHFQQTYLNRMMLWNVVKCPLVSFRDSVGDISKMLSWKPDKPPEEHNQGDIKVYERGNLEPFGPPYRNLVSWSERAYRFPDIMAYGRYSLYPVLENRMPPKYKALVRKLTLQKIEGDADARILNHPKLPILLGGGGDRLELEIEATINETVGTQDNIYWLTAELKYPRPDPSDVAGLGTLRCQLSWESHATPDIVDIKWDKDNYVLDFKMGVERSFPVLLINNGSTSVMIRKISFEKQGIAEPPAILTAEVPPLPVTIEPKGKLEIRIKGLFEEPFGEETIIQAFTTTNDWIPVAFITAKVTR